MNSPITAGFGPGKKTLIVTVTVAVAASVLLLYGAMYSGTQDKHSEIPDSMALTNNDFAIDFYRQVSDEDRNVFVSPASMYMAFSMLYEGAGGKTASQMLDVFEFESDTKARHNATSHTLSSLNRHDSHAELAMANAVWTYGFEPPPTYVDIVRDVYLADIDTFDTPNEGAKKINAWASDKTHGKITDVIKPKSLIHLAGMVLTNAVYFKGTWVTQFPEEDTRKSNFWTDSEQSVKADFMNVRGNFNYTQTDGIQVLKLPYKGDRLSMLILLPLERDGIYALEDTMSAENVREWQLAVAGIDVAVSVPKFEMELTYNLTDPMMSLGMVDAFDAGLADFPGIHSQAYVTNATQKTYVDVNEEGTEAAAVTVIEVAIESEPSLLPFVADHPFIFIIQDDESGAILFMGKVTDPTG